MKLQIAFIVLLTAVSCGPRAEINFEDKELLEFQLGQRTSKDIPAINGKVKVEIGDITGGQTWLTISKDSIPVFERSIHENNTLNFKIDKTDYKITCTELINNLIGYDLATFRILKKVKL